MDARKITGWSSNIIGLPQNGMMISSVQYNKFIAATLSVNVRKITGWSVYILTYYKMT